MKKNTCFFDQKVHLWKGARYLPLFHVGKRAIWQPPKRRGGKGVILYFFPEAQFTPLSPDINPISVSQTINF